MKMARWPRLLSLVLGVVWGVGVADGFAQTNRTNKVLIYPNATDSIRDLKARGVTNVRDYGSYWLAEATDTQVAALQARLGDRLTKANYLNVIELQTKALDTTTTPAVEPTVVSGRQFYLVQFAGPILPAWVEELKRAGANIVSYIPNNAYLVRLDSAAAAKIRLQLAPRGPIQWIGDYQPGYKISQSLQNAAGEMAVRIAVLKGDAASLSQIRALALAEIKPAQQLRQETILYLRVNAVAIPALAARSDVLRIEPVPQYRRLDEKASLITATFTNVVPGHAPTPGDDYINWLLGLGFSAEGEDYPIVDVADSGLDKAHPILGSLYPIHPDFYEIPVPTVQFMIQSTVDELAAQSLNRTARVAYRFTGDDTDGHGTLVASVVAGAGDSVSEALDVYTRNQSEVCTSNLIYCGFNPVTGDIVCLTNQPLPGVDPVVEVSCTNTCEVLVNDPAGPIDVEKTDDDGFRYGTGINPFGRVGASFGGAEPGFLGPELAIGNAYIGRARISNNSWGQAPVVIGLNDGVYDLDAMMYDSLVRDAIQLGQTNNIVNPGLTNNIPGPAPLNQEMIIVFAGGNANGASAGGGFADVLVTPPATAKNIIAVGATENVRPDDGCLPFESDQDESLDISYFSSFGPTRDGRFRPDIVAPGASIYAAKSQATYVPVTSFGPDPLAPEDPCGGNAVEVDLYSDLYECVSGTSFAAPAVAGASQLLWWWFRNELGMLPPSPAATKAYLMNSARYLPSQNPLFPGALDTLPSSAQGMGMLDLERMFDRVSRVVRDQSTPRALDTGLITTNPVPQQTYFTRTGQSYELEGLVASNDRPFRVTLAWTDAPAEPNSFVNLVNNLELEVTIGGKLYKGNVFVGGDSHSAPQAAFDDVNNVESVFLPAGGAVTSGAPYKVVVRAFNIAGDGVPNVGPDLDQDFALVVYNSQTNEPPSDAPNLTTNDVCQTAWDISSFPAVITNTINKTDYNNNHPSPSAARGGVEAFFKIETPTPGTTFSITTAGSAFSPVLSVWRVQTVPQTVFISGKCGALIEVISTNAAGNGNSALSFTADGSNTYFIVAEPFNNGNGGRLVLNLNASAPLISASPALLDFGEVMAGLVSETKTVTFQNNSSVNVYVADVSVTGDFAVDADACTGSLIPPGGTCTIRVVFAPTTTGPLTGQLIITDDATGSPRIVELSGTGVAPAPLICLSSSAAIVFTNTAVGELSSDSPKTLILTNCGQAVLNVTNVVVTGAGSNDFTVVEDCQSGSPIAVDGTCTFSIQFTPVTNGTRTATLRIFSDDGATPKTVTLQGTGFTRTPVVCLGANSLTFSNTVVGEVSDSLSVTITNCGTTNLVISGVGIVGSHPADFAVVNNTCADLATGQTCQVTLTFNPTEGGNRTATLAITNNASGSPHLVTLSGNALSSQPDGLIGRYNRLRFNRQGKAIGFIGQDILNLDAAGQTLTNRLRRGSRLPMRNYVVLRNTGSTADAFVIQGPGDSNGFQIRYYLGTTTDVEITDEVTNGGFEAGRLAPAALTGDATFMRVDLYATTNAVRGTTNSFLITTTSVADPAKQDAVQATVIAR